MFQSPEMLSVMSLSEKFLTSHGKHTLETR